MRYEGSSLHFFKSLSYSAKSLGIFIIQIGKKYQLQSISIKTNVYNKHTSSPEKAALVTRLNMTKQYS
jgi:hypothetical protein